MFSTVLQPRVGSTPSQTAYLVIGGMVSGCLHWYVVSDFSFLFFSSTMPQVDAHISIFRGEVRSVAGATIASYGIIDPDQANEYLLLGLTYIYPVDPAVSPLPVSLQFSLTTSIDQEASRR